MCVYINIYGFNVQPTNGKWHFSYVFISSSFLLFIFFSASGVGVGIESIEVEGVDLGSSPYPNRANTLDQLLESK